jgi:DNA-binding phage protein
VAKATGLHHNTLHNFMKGSGKPSVQTLDALLSYLFPV